jgi:predicted transposase YbfD/YdcC
VIFPGARLVARLETRVKRKDPQTKKKKWSREVVYLVSSLTLAELQAQGMLSLKRGYWVVESRLHHCLDITLREDTSRVRTPKAARILGTIRRVVVSLANAAVNRARKKNPKTKYNTGTFQSRFKSARGGRERLHALITAKFPNILEL